MAKRFGKVRTVYRTARARSRAAGRTIPLMGVATGAAFGAGLMLNGAPDYGGESPMVSINRRDYIGAAAHAASNLRNPKTYIGVALPGVAWFLGRTFLGKCRITKRFSLF